MKKVAVSSLASEIPRKVIDNKSETVAELALSTGQPVNWLRRYANEQVRLGKWEQVFKQSGRQTVPAYRRKV